MNLTDPEGIKVVIRWVTTDKDAIHLIRKRFDVAHYTTLNGLSPAILKPEDADDFKETARRGYFSYFTADWKFNGVSYSW